MQTIEKPVQSFPFLSDVLKPESPEDSIGLGLWAGANMVIWLKSEGIHKWLGVLDEGVVAIEAHFVTEKGFPKSIIFAGEAIGDGGTWEGVAAEDQLERIATLAKTLSNSMQAAIVVSERALIDAGEFRNDRASALTLQELNAHLELLCKDGKWLPTLCKR